MKAVFTAATGSATHGEPKVMGIRNPPNAPTALTMPSTAEASFGTRASAALRSGEPSGPASFAWPAQMAGIIRYAEPFPMPVAAKTNRKATRNHGKIPELWLTAEITAGGKPGKLDGSLAQAVSLSADATGTGSSAVRVASTASVPRIIATNASAVTRAPPNRSDSQPPKGRVSEPTRAPRKA